tara:strand:+ start:2310 stop:2510 length:201 start_codon:yes stop_codon:yes gene_type:complete
MRDKIVVRDKILPCPFCGESNTIIIDIDRTMYFNCVECVNCGARGPFCLVKKDIKKDAIKKWNIRL